MKKISGIVLILVMLVAQIPASFAASALPFSDVKESDWYYDSVQFVYENGMMGGTSATKFEPEDTLTRAMFVTILGRYAEVDTEEYKNVSFSDVKAGQWYTPYIEWAVRNNVTSGSGSTFRIKSLYEK